MIEYFVSDLDGTLLKSDETIASDDIEAILRWQEMGKHFIVASGRPTSFMGHLEKLGIRPEYMLGSTGSVLSDGTSDEVLGAIDEHEAIKMVEFLDGADETDYVIDAYHFVGHYAKDEFGYFKEHMRTSKIDDVKKPRTFFELNEPILKFFVICKDDEVAFDIARQVNDGFDGYFRAYHADRGCLEIVSKNTGKWSAIKALAQKLGTDTEQFACIGDEENDKAMIKNCGMGFAMANASEDVKKAADRVVKSVKEAISVLLKE